MLSIVCLVMLGSGAFQDVCDRWHCYHVERFSFTIIVVIGFVQSCSSGALLAAVRGGTAQSTDWVGVLRQLAGERRVVCCFASLLCASMHVESCGHLLCILLWTQQRLACVVGGKLVQT